tara:strand:- start:278 stop:514 length:237 start_codon:yes stop_codon:yes gene_type:complete
MTSTAGGFFLDFFASSKASSASLDQYTFTCSLFILAPTACSLQGVAPHLGHDFTACGCFSSALIVNSSEQDLSTFLNT